MKIVGIIAEYNPFHNGHEYHINKAKEITGADYAIVVMSGNYVQRGEPAIFNKYLRANCALQNGADIVIELPTVFSTASAEVFAAGAISILNNLGIVDYICFGSESGDINVLSKISDILTNETENLKSSLSANIKAGMSYPAAMAESVNNYIELNDSNIIKNILSSPNNILAIEYLKALNKSDSSIKPYTITRLDNGYNNLSLENRFSSAASIRSYIKNSSIDAKTNDKNISLENYTEDIVENILDEIAHAVPANCIEILKTNSFYPIFANDYSQILGSKLLTSDFDKLNAAYDVSSDFANKVLKYKDSFTNIEDFSMKLKSKNVTYNYIMRALFHIILDINSSLLDKIKENNYKSYARLLGFKKSSPVLSAMKAHTDIPIVSKFANAYKEFYDTNKLILNANLNGDHLYRMITMNKNSCILPTEFQSNLIII